MNEETEINEEESLPAADPKPSHLSARWATLVGDYRLVDVKLKEFTEGRRIVWAGKTVKKWKWCPSGTKIYRVISLPLGLVGALILLGCMATMVYLMFTSPAKLALIKSLPVSFNEMTLFSLALMGNAGGAQIFHRKKSNGTTIMPAQQIPINTR